MLDIALAYGYNEWQMNMCIWEPANRLRGDCMIPTIGNLIWVMPA